MKTFNTIQYFSLIHNSYSHFVSYFNNVLYCCFFNGTVSNPGLHTAFSHLVSLVSFDLEKFASLFLLWFTFLKSLGQVFCRMSLHLDLSNVAWWLILGYMFLVRKPQKSCWTLFSALPIRSMWCWLVSLLAVLTLTNWLRWCLCFFFV